MDVTNRSSGQTTRPRLHRCISTIEKYRFTAAPTKSSATSSPRRFWGCNKTTRKPMDFDLTDEQRLLKESVDRLILDQYQLQQRKQYMTEPPGFSPAMWSRFAEQGLLGLPFPETTGGFGGGSIETMLVMEAFGRGLVVEPYFATVILPGGLLIRAGDQALSASLVPQITAGTLKLAFGHVERHSRYDLANVTTSARKDGDAYILNGAKSVVLHGDAAGKILVTARLAGAPMDRNGIGLFLLDATSPGLTRRGYPTQDG